MTEPGVNGRFTGGSVSKARLGWTVHMVDRSGACWHFWRLTLRSASKTMLRLGDRGVHD